MHDEEGIREQRKESRAKWLSIFSSIVINRAMFILTFQRVQAVPPCQCSVLYGTIMYCTYVSVPVNPFALFHNCDGAPHHNSFAPLERELEREKTARL